MTLAMSVSAQSAAQIASEHRGEIEDLPLEAAQGLPVPVWEGGQLFLEFPFFLSHGRPRSSRELFEPEWIVKVDLETGVVSGVDRRHAGEHRPAGILEWDPARTVQDVEADRALLFRMIDELLGLARGGDGVLHAPAPVASKFAEVWQRLEQKPLHECYRSLNPAWFDAFGL